MKVYILCPVRNTSDKQKKEVDSYIETLESQGIDVHSYKNVDQNDKTGYEIVMGHLRGMQSSDEVHVFWDVKSKGSHCDLGMALALGKRIKMVKCFEDNKGKSYWKALKEYIKRNQ